MDQFRKKYEVAVPFHPGEKTVTRDPESKFGGAVQVLRNTPQTLRSAIRFARVAAQIFRRPIMVVEEESVSDSFDGQVKSRKERHLVFGHDGRKLGEVFPKDGTGWNPTLWARGSACEGGVPIQIPLNRQEEMPGAFRPEEIGKACWAYMHLSEGVDPSVAAKFFGRPVKHGHASILANYSGSSGKRITKYAPRLGDSQYWRYRSFM